MSAYMHSDVPELISRCSFSAARPSLVKPHCVSERALLWDWRIRQSGPGTGWAWQTGPRIHRPGLCVSLKAGGGGQAAPSYWDDFGKCTAAWCAELVVFRSGSDNQCRPHRLPFSQKPCEPWPHMDSSSQPGGRGQGQIACHAVTSGCILGCKMLYFAGLIWEGLGS